MGKSTIEVFEFDIDKVLEYGNKIEDLEERKKYFKKVLKIKKNNKTILDHSIGDRERYFVEEVRAEIEDINLSEIVEKKNVDKKENVDEGINRELENSHVIIRRLKKKLTVAKYGITQSQLYDIIEETRKKSGKVNYSAIGRELGVTNHTAETRCKHFNLK